MGANMDRRSPAVLADDDMLYVLADDQPENELMANPTAPPTSFPFLAIARDFGVPYREVLAIADVLEQRPLKAGGLLHMAVAQALSCEQARRRAVEHARAVLA
jgi:hypothetical protein